MQSTEKHRKVVTLTHYGMVCAYGVCSPIGRHGTTQRTHFLRQNQSERRKTSHFQGWHIGKTDISETVSTTADMQYQYSDIG